MSVLAKWPTPKKHQMGYSINPLDGAETILYADCADCGAREPEIAGHLGEDTPPHQPLLVKVDTVIAKEALYCAPCFEKRWAQP